MSLTDLTTAAPTTIKGTVVAKHARNGTVVLETLYYPDEIRKPEVEGLDEFRIYSALSEATSFDCDLRC